ncbi:MAG: NUDIX domain-containing protein [Candidatus Aenigmarchaeota archaeon]|nr:NUDIX domain-containing protein [Candidatus Aenigmarchaeota archaeon]
MYKNHFKLLCAVYLVLKKDGKVLMLRRFNTGFADGNYSLIAGHVDGGESVFDAMARETKEETGIDIKHEDLKVIHIMHRRCESPDYERFCVFLEASKYSGEIKNMEPNKCDDVRWFPINDLPVNTVDYVKMAIKNSDGGIFFSEDGWG